MSDPTKTPALDAFPIELDRTRYIAFPVESLFQMDATITAITGKSVFLGCDLKKEFGLPDGDDPAPLPNTPDMRRLFEWITAYLWGGLLAETQDKRERKESDEQDLSLSQVRRMVGLRSLDVVMKPVWTALAAWMPEPDPIKPATEPAKESTSVQ